MTNHLEDAKINKSNRLTWIVFKYSIHFKICSIDTKQGVYDCKNKFFAAD